MATIEERADLAWRDWYAERYGHWSELGAAEADDEYVAFTDGYLTGSAQTQRDYVAHYEAVHDA
jgi:hypothetical protein